jgi:predicted deacylase
MAAKVVPLPYCNGYDPKLDNISVFTFGKGSPSVCFTGGIHGNEATGIYVCEKLIEIFSNEPLQKGSIRVIPRCNPRAFNSLTRVSPLDGVDMNRIFPGSTSGTPTLAAAATIWEETSRFDCLIDIHCCGQHGLPYMLATFTEHPLVREMACRISFPSLLKSEGTAGQLFVESCKKRNQRALLIELPNGLSNACLNFPAGQLCIGSLLNFLRGEGMISGKYIHHPPEAFSGMTDLKAPFAGLWIPAVARGDEVAQSQPIGSVNGHPVASPCAGKAAIIKPAAYVREKDEVATIWRRMGDGMSPPA